MKKQLSDFENFSVIKDNEDVLTEILGENPDQILSNEFSKKETLDSSFEKLKKYEKSSNELAETIKDIKHLVVEIDEYYWKTINKEAEEIKNS